MIVQIKLPDSATLQASKGSAVKIGDAFYEISQGELQSISVSDKLKINPHDIFATTSVVVGDHIKENDIVAQKKGLMRKKQVKSPFSGTVTKIDHETGDIFISSEGSKTQMVPAYFNGTIKDFKENESIVSVEIKGGAELESDSITFDGGGELYYLQDDRDYYQISEESIKGRTIVLADAAAHMVPKLEALAAGGIISKEGTSTGSFPTIILTEESFKKLLDHAYRFIIYSSHEQQVIAYN